MVKDEWRRCVAAWILLCAILVALMVILGGYTRLSGAGLSITEWKPVHGVIPPLSDTAWQEEFARYRASPQFEKINFGMTLEGFKSIYWPEYFHRLLGRVIGIVFLLPLVCFTWNKAISRRLTLRLAGIFALGGAQGLLGWYMVQSGLVNNPHVSHLRLAAHLGLALLILGLLFWTWLDIRRPLPTPLPQAGKGGAIPLFVLLCIQILYGALTAGLHGGLVYNTFPAMDGQWLPAALWPDAQPWWRILTENVPTVQFIHRWLAMLLGGALILWWFAQRPHVINTALRRVLDATLAVCLAQILLGILTLLHQAPLPLALLHQFTALALFVLMLTLVHALHKSHNLTGHDA